jgi:hypothetical protein
MLLIKDWSLKSVRGERLEYRLFQMHQYPPVHCNISLALLYLLLPLLFLITSVRSKLEHVSVVCNSATSADANNRISQPFVLIVSFPMSIKTTLML